MSLKGDYKIRPCDPCEDWTRDVEGAPRERLGACGSWTEVRVTDTRLKIVERRARIARRRISNHREAVIIDRASLARAQIDIENEPGTQNR